MSGGNLIGEGAMALKTHVGFSIPTDKKFGPRIVSHFSRLGFQLIDEPPNEWVFQRGNKLAAIWRFDVRAYATTLTVRARAEQSDGIWVSSDWEVWTFMNLTTGGDVATLEAEGHQLESILREPA